VVCSVWKFAWKFPDSFYQELGKKVELKSLKPAGQKFLCDLDIKGK
jgi:hypothetical protein